MKNIYLIECCDKLLLIRIYITHNFTIIENLKTYMISITESNTIPSILKKQNSLKNLPLSTFLRVGTCVIFVGCSILIEKAGIVALENRRMNQ